MSNIWSILDKLLTFIGPEGSTASGRMNLVGFIISVSVLASPKLFRGAVWVLEWLMFLLSKLFKKKLKAPIFPDDKWGSWPLIVLFSSLVICLIFTNTSS